MSEGTEAIRRQIQSAGELQAVVRSMKALAASSVGQYEKSVLALSDYSYTVEMGLHACFRQIAMSAPLVPVPKANGKVITRNVGAIIFGSDQGLVGQFNDLIVDYAMGQLSDLRSEGPAKIWAVGERVEARLANRGRPSEKLFSLPSSVDDITPLVDDVLKCLNVGIDEMYLFYNRPTSGASYEPNFKRLLPLDNKWEQNLAARAWPTKTLPEVLGSVTDTLRSLISEYLFVSIFRACSESLASENESRLAAMQRADKNIKDLLEGLNGTFHQLRQSSIDEELFEVVSGYEALTG
jgi:F-type H+-transporting ATPase subunit gamma